ncbi:unnamed protein product [Arabis nemorensis]|uniref:Uncharacterized protein n=1 Tax=Arabis nemorensis TaxID=586526 RepID=A0A565BUZ7_9BRAS|nr:unnamed protein product [Arabis nemorensis]
MFIVFVHVPKALVCTITGEFEGRLDSGNYGLWKSRMKCLIGGIKALALRAVLVRWETPTIVDAEGLRSAKPEETVSKKTFELIQGCQTVKKATNLLQVHFEGTIKVHNSRKDMLTSRFENPIMEKH